jgi:hypothetical protein
MSPLLPLFRWLGHTTVGVFLARSTWGFPIIEMVHLIGLAGLGGEILIVDLRLLGIGTPRLPISRVARELLPLFVTSLVIMLASGILLVSAEAVKCYYNPAFRAKMVSLLFAIIISWAIQRKLIRSEVEDHASSGWLKAAAILSLVLWLSVGAAGRLIGFL